jgi:hypothetical protein
MSVVLDGSNNLVATAVWAEAPSSYPFSISIWVRPDTTDSTEVAASIEDNGSNPKNIAQLRGSVAGDYVAAGTYGSGWALAYTSSGYSASTWQHVLVVFNSDTDRRVYLDGGSKGTDTTNQNGDTGLDIAYVGKYSGGGNFTGKLAEFAVWDIALSDADAVLLAAGNAANTVESGNLIQYNKLAASGVAHTGSALTEVNNPTWDTGDDPDVSEYVDGAVTITGTGSLSATGEIVIDAVATITGSGSLTVSAVTTQNPLVFKRRLVVAGSDCIYYEA